MSRELIIAFYSFMGFLMFFFVTHWCCHAMLLLLLSSRIHVSGEKVTVIQVLQRYLRSVPSDKVTSCAVFAVVHLFPLFKILICQFCPQGNSKTTWTSPHKTIDVFLLLSLSLASFWEVGGCRNSGTCGCFSSVCTPRDSSMLNWAWSSPGEKRLLKRQSEQSLCSQWGLAASGRIPGCKHSFFKDLISCYVLMWLLEWFWKRRFQQGFASRLDVLLFFFPVWTCINFVCHFACLCYKETWS